MISLGTRPEAIKLAPVIYQLKKCNYFRVKVCVTAQHREMLDQVLRIFEIIPDYDLNVMVEGQTLFAVSEKVLKGMERVLNDAKPDLLMVQGDTTSALVASLAAFYDRIALAHVEAGLRTYDKYRPFPEELNRRLISHIADINFAPTKVAKKFLTMENAPGSVFVTGNTVVDALMITARRLSKGRPHIPQAKRMILLTVHRRESFGKPLKNIFRAISKIARQNKMVHILYPVHPNPNVSGVAKQMLGGIDNIKLVKPLDYLSLVSIMAHSYIILTDSGGIQEEAPTFGKPVLILREKTERPEALMYGTARLVGTDKAMIVAETQRLLSSPGEYRKLTRKTNPFGDGKAASRVVGFLKHYYGFSARIPKEFL